LITKYLVEKKHKDMVIVSPDVGGVKRANKMADLLNAPIAIIDKIRREHNKCEVAHVVGDVSGKTAIIIDDMVDTGGSICAAADVVKKYGAKEVIICATHALLNGKAKENLENCSASEVIFLDTIPIPKDKRIKKMKIISLAPLLSKIIHRIHTERSLGELFKWEEQSKLL